jgi:hypothetical protein
MTSFQQALDFVDQAVSGGGGAQPPLTLDDAFSFVDSAIAAEMPGATPGARDEDIQAIAAQEYAGMVDVVPDIDVGIMPREVARGAVGMFTQAAQAVATPGMRAQFIESVLSPMLMFQMPFIGSAARRQVARGAARTVSQALEPAGSGLSVEDVETEAMAMRGAQAGLAAGQREGFRAEASRAVGQVVPQAAAVAGAVLTGQPVVAAALASNAVMPLMGFTSGQIAYMDELDQKRADEAAAGKPLSEFDIGEMGRRGAITGAIAAGVEAVGAATGTRLVGKALAAAAKPATKNVAIARLAQAGQDKAARVLATRAGQAGAQAFARITAGTGQIANGFIGQAGKALALSAAEEGVEEFAEGMLNAPFTYAPMSEDLWNAVSAAAVGSVAGGVGGGIGVTGAVTQRSLANRREAMRPETDKERILRQSHAEAIAKRVDWTKDLDDTQRAEIAVALDTLNGMDQEERGTFLQEMRDRQADAVNFIDMLLAERKQLDDAIAGLEVSERRMIEDQPRVEGERAAKQEAVREAEAAFTQAEADLAAAQEILAEAEGAAGVRPRVARPGRKIVTPEEARRNVESAQALVEEQRKNVTAALSQVEAAEGLEIDEGIRIDPVAMRADLLSDIAKNDAALKTAVTDKLIADARANAVAEKISDMPAVVEQKASGDVLSDLGTSMGQTFTQVKAPRKASKLTKDLAALGVNVVWFRSSGRFIPAFHSRKSRGTIYLNADMDPRTVRARAFEEMFHDIQMFQPDIAESYSELVGLAPIYRAGMEYVTRGGPESEQIGRLDVAAVEQLGAAGAALRGERAAIQPGVARAGAARLAQEGEANAFAEAAAAMTTNRVLAPISRFAARRGLMGREARAAMAVIDAAARSAAIAKVKGTQGDATLSPLARTLMWAEDLNVSYAREIEEATQPKQPAAEAAQTPAAGVSMAREFPSRPLSSFTPEWRAWFGDSKVVDENGNPRVVYHATRAAKDFDVFKITKDLGYHFGSTPDAANRALGSRVGGVTQSGGARIYPVYLSIKNPLRVSETGSAMMGDLGGWNFGDLVGQFYRPVKLRQSNLFRYEPEANEFDVPEGMSIPEAMRTGQVTRTEPRPGLIDMTPLEYVQKINAEVRAELGELTKTNRVKFNRAALQKFVADLKRLGYDGLVYKNIVEGGGDSWIAFDSNQIKSVFNERPTAAPGISMAREDSADIEAMRTEIAALQRQMRDVQNVTAAQRARAMREVNLLQRRLVTAQLIAEQKIGQAERLRKRMEREREVSESSIADAQEAIGRLERDLDEAEAALRSEREKAKAGPGSAAAIRSAQRAIDFAYRIGRREGLVAGEVRGQQVGLRETAAAERRVERAERRVVTSAERIDELLGRIGEAKSEISDLRRNIRTDAALAQRAADLAYRMGLRSGQVQGMMRGRQQVLRVLRKREDALARQLDNLRTLNALRSDQVAERAAIVRKIAADAVDMLPVRLRGPLAKRAATATTVQQANRIAVEATREAVNNEVSTALAVIKATRKKMNRRGMRNVTRERVETLLDQADAMLRDTANRRLAAKVVSGPKAGLGPGASVVTNAVSLYSAVLDASLLVEQAVAEVQAERDAWERERAARVARYADLKSRLGSNLAMRPTLEERARADESPRIGALASMQRAASDIYTLMLETEGTQDGALGELVSIAQRGKGESSLEHARMIRDLAPALSGAGYESLSDYALRNGLMGESAAETIDVVLGGRTLTLPVGKVLSVAAMDDETLGLMDGSQPITFRGAETTMRVSPTRQEIEAIRSSLTPGQRDLIDAMKSILETRVRDRVMDAIWRVEGDQPPIVRNYWPRIRKTDLDAETADVLRSASAAVRSALTSVGFAQARTGSKSPLVYDDAFRTWDRHLQVSLDMIHMAQPYRDALSVLTDGEIESALDRRMGDGTANILRAFFANGVGATARSNVTLIDAITNNVTGAILSLSPRTAAKVYVGGTIRLMSEMPSGLWARGVARAIARAANPQAWSARIDEIHSVNGYFTRRHQMHMRSIVSGTLSDADRTTVSTALSAMAASLRGAGQNVAAGNFTDAARAVREVANGANMAVTAFVDALRYADEQIMLVAVESRLAEVEDEGILTGTEALREAALRAERDFRLTQNASDEFDETATVAMTRTAKGTPYIRFLFPFSSDPLKARNQIRRAWLTGEARARTALAITGNTATSTLIGAASTPALMAMYYAVMNAIGGDDEERKTLPPELQKEFDEQAKRIPVAVAREILSSATGYLGIIVGSIVDSIVNRRAAFVPLAVRPVEQTAREAGRMFGEEGTMLRIIPATLALSQLAGMPFYQLYRFVEGFVPPSTVTPEERLRKKVERRTKALTPESVQERVRRRVEQLRRGG